jgi:hypothetical protein
VSFELFFILVGIPFFIACVCLELFQRKFFFQYNKIFYPEDPVSVVDLFRLFQTNPSKAYKFLSKNFFKFFFFGWRVYFKKYDDNKLNQYAFFVRTIFFSLILIMIFGFIMFFFI